MIQQLSAEAFFFYPFWFGAVFLKNAEKPIDIVGMWCYNEFKQAEGGANNVWFPQQLARRKDVLSNVLLPGM